MMDHQRAAAATETGLRLKEQNVPAHMYRSVRSADEAKRSREAAFLKPACSFRFESLRGRRMTDLRQARHHVSF